MRMLNVILGFGNAPRNDFRFNNFKATNFSIRFYRLCPFTPTFSVLCYLCPFRSLLPHNVISPTTFLSSNWLYLYLPLCVSDGPSIFIDSDDVSSPLPFHVGYVCDYVCQTFLAAVDLYPFKRLVIENHLPLPLPCPQSSCLRIPYLNPPTTSSSISNPVPFPNSHGVPCSNHRLLPSLPHLFLYSLHCPSPLHIFFLFLSLSSSALPLPIPLSTPSLNPPPISIPQSSLSPPSASCPHPHLTPPPLTAPFRFPPFSPPPPPPPAPFSSL